MTVASAVDDVRSGARRAADSGWADRWARLGFIARGVVYVLIGILALQVARRGGGGADASRDGALREVAERPLGGPILVALVIGMAGYALWRATEAVWGRRDEDDERKRTAKRLLSGGRAVLYGVFCITTVRFIQNGPREAAGGEQDEKVLVARVLELPAGRWLVGAAGAVVIAGALYSGYRGLAGRFQKKLDTSAMGPVTGRTIDWLGAVGLAARALVFVLIGYLLIRSAIDFDPNEARGLDGTLELLVRQSYGQAILAVTALGLIAYGLYSWAEARYREL